MNITRTFPVFAAAFAVSYVIAVEANLAVVTYHPRLGLWEWGAQPIRSGPAMHWYGWLLTSFAGGVVASLAALPATRTREIPAWIGWAIPLAAMASFLYFLGNFFFY